MGNSDPSGIGQEKKTTNMCLKSNCNRPDGSQSHYYLQSLWFLLLGKTGDSL